MSLAAVDMVEPSLRSSGLQPAEPAELSLRALRVFVAVEEAGSMALAAERLHASPSAVSQQVSNLERALGARVFDRIARPIALTPAGLLLRRHAHRILEAVGEAQTELIELNLATLPELRLAIIDDLDASITPDLVSRLAEQYPRCVFTASSGRSDVLTEAFLRREADIVLTAEPPPEDSALERLPILREPFALVTARGAVDPERDLESQLQALPFVRYSRSMPMGRAIGAHLRRLRLVLPERYAFDTSRSVFAMVRNTGGWAITTPLSVLDSERFWPDLDVLPLPFAGLSRTIHLVARRDELGRLPELLAGQCRALIATRLVPRVLEIAPFADGAFILLDC